MLPTELIEHLLEAFSLLRSENNIIIFEKDSLSDEDCFNLTGVSKHSLKNNFQFSLSAIKRV